MPGAAVDSAHPFSRDPERASVQVIPSTQLLQRLLTLRVPRMLFEQV
jgi:hypothetical protein